ncbi:alpha/beta hydrolase [Rhodococcus sp. NCIMB 12038]|uniref:alpha/beta hydrolase n=1 Tax=Rhodococcus sp. NCIMB 12038 TaxID=933800 RepID=UPI000B3C0F3A|nr:hypothetical protein CA951_29635 [Rhodococcus sp. NCIMB 12038]
MCAIEHIELRWERVDGSWVAGSAYLPPAPRAVVVCFPGGRLDRSYWDLQVSGDETRSYSFSHFAAMAGVAVITIDHLGTGDSAREVLDLSPSAVAQANAEATASFVDQLGLADVPAAGVGHSMGAALLLRQQMISPFPRLALLGYPSRELVMWRPGGSRWLLTDSDADYSRHDLAYTNVGPRLEGPLLTAVRNATTPVPDELGSWVSRPGAVAEQIRALDVPVFLGFGERDVVRDPWEEPSAYVNAPQVQLEILEDSHHCHNLSPARRSLWQALIVWVST